MAKNYKTSLRFITVGLLNTIIDFGTYSGLISIGIPSVIANYPATTIAIIFSYFANKKYTFKDNNKKIPKQVALFLLVTLTGLWVIQPIIIVFTESIAQQRLNNMFIGSIAAKLIATAVSLTWNYLLYSRIVFKAKE